ncbi:LacI family DNA-binding transcriptional regulator [Kitasatospora cheerisanensis]|uniref:LacI family transcription regulator n=1 Tax=Kitasatospora cheerisanensis KCTC 2395 TaxID=1348663 RepID=A0A066YVW8_9ACTN|nr:LacI family DNA-binding transcriptional regulator [Kitasatospora cheerisanensis]KDN82085.1 LacI family transcription regulator [Kitasatospora cheerisanensis KCTC 2395]
MERRLTLHDVAREAGVSAKTVSRVLNGDGPVAAATRERVLAVVERVGFRPNLLARSIRTGGPDATVGLVLPDLANPFFGALAGGVEEAARARGLTVLLGCSGGDAAREAEVVSAFLARRTAALLVVPAAGGEASAQARAAGVPLVFVDRPGPDADCVVSSNRAGAREGVAHLLGLGHRRVAFLGDLPAGLYTRRERLAGYREALREAGAAPDGELVADARTAAEAERAVLRLLALPDPPTALFASNVNAATGAVLALGRAGRRDVALLAFDDLPLAEVLDPPLSAVAQDPAGLGAAAARLALARLDGDATPPRTETVPTRLVLRGAGPAARP